MAQRQAGRGRWRREVLGFALVGLAVLVASCALPNGEVVQGGGLPNLQRLNWGYFYYENALWSPDGRWIAVVAGPDITGSHLVVLSTDGRTHHDLNAWGCGIYLEYNYAWLPDSALSCVTDHGQLIIGSAPFTAPAKVALQAHFTSADTGASWTTDGTDLVVASLSRPDDPVNTVGNGALYQVSRAGQVDVRPLTPPTQDSSRPAWAPSGSALAYLEQPSLGEYTLELSAVTRAAQGTLSLGTPHTLATNLDAYYAWSPSGRWIVVWHPDYQSGDKMYLVNVANPTQTVDVIAADRVGQQMMDPIWSPDGNTLIVFSVGYGTAQPYSLDIGAYLRGKGLQP